MARDSLKKIAVSVRGGTELGKLIERLEYAKTSIRAKVEHPFYVMKNIFKHHKARYKGSAKNTAQLVSLFALTICCWLAAGC